MDEALQCTEIYVRHWLSNNNNPIYSTMYRRMLFSRNRRPVTGREEKKSSGKIIDTAGQIALQRHHNGQDGVSNHQPRDCLLNRLSKRRSKKSSKLCVTGLCAGHSPVTGEFPAQMTSDVENVSNWLRLHGPNLRSADIEWHNAAI